MENFKKEELKKNVKRGIKIFLTLTVLVLFVIFLLTVDKNTFSSLRKFTPLHMLLAILLWCIMAGSDYLALMVFARGTGNKINFFESLSVITIGQFLSLVTPFQVSGLPVQIFYMKKKCNIDYGAGTSIMFIRGVAGLTIFILSAPLVFLFAGDAFENPLIRNTTRIIGFLTIVAILVLLMFLLNPRRFSGLLKGRGSKFFNQIFTFRETFLKFFSKAWGHFLIGLLLLLISFSAYFMIAPVLMKGLNLEISFVKVILFQVILRFALFFSPSPGASGFAEAGFAGLFYSMIPKNLLGIYVSLWRFFTAYINAIIGGIMTMKFIKEV